MANVRQGRFEAEHSANNSFVKRQQDEMARYAGRKPEMKEEMLDFCSHMSNNGMHAQELARDLTKDIDHVAFPVKGASREENN
jgi:hypothetical protein